MAIVEAGHGLLPRGHPAAPGEAQRDALGMIHAHVDLASRAGSGPRGRIAWKAGSGVAETDGWRECAPALQEWQAVMWHMRGCGWCRSGKGRFGKRQREIYQ